MNIKSALAPALVGITLTSVGITLAACTEGPARTASARAIVTSDGYTPIAIPAGTIDSAKAKVDVSSFAAGIRTSDSSRYQMVVVLTPAGVAILAPQLQSATRSAAADGVTVSETGDVLTATGSESAMGSLPSIG
jgi:hypothetical protein